MKKKNKKKSKTKTRPSGRTTRAVPPDASPAPPAAPGASADAPDTGVTAEFKAGRDL